MNIFYPGDVTPRTLTVTELNLRIKSLIGSETLLQSIMIEGEISNFSGTNRSGHIYFTLKDSSSSLKAVMFAGKARYLRFTPENGMKVIITGSVGVYERDGVYQLNCDKMEPLGSGALAVAFEQLKRKLAAEGLFATEHKKTLPRFPQKIGVITSPTGAAVRDILSILTRRYPLAEIIFRPVSVQGSAAAGEMIDAIEKFKPGDADVIIIGRGGGSAEDLWCFNDELLARAIYACPIPVISAVGHETDFSISDFAADVRAATPSAAAEICAPDISGLMLDVEKLSQRLNNTYCSKLALYRAALDNICSKRSFASPQKFFEKDRLQIKTLQSRLYYAASIKASVSKADFEKAAAALKALNPQNVLDRGYALVQLDNKTVSEPTSIQKGDKIKIIFACGEIIATVDETKIKR